MQLNDELLWDYVEQANWKSDNDYERCKVYYDTLDPSIRKAVEEFAHDKTGELHDKYQKDWLGNPGISCSDDGWWDLRADVVGRGREFYESITVEKLREMADNHDYEESFLYSFQ